MTDYAARLAVPLGSGSIDPRLPFGDLPACRLANPVGESIVHVFPTRLLTGRSPTGRSPTTLEPLRLPDSQMSQPPSQSEKGLPPDHSYHRDQGEHRVLLKRKLWQDPSVSRLDSVYCQSCCANFARLLSDTSL